MPTHLALRTVGDDRDSPSPGENCGPAAWKVAQARRHASLRAAGLGIEW